MTSSRPTAAPFFDEIDCRPPTAFRRVGLWLRTARYLKPTQALHRARLRARRVIDPWWYSRPPRARPSLVASDRRLPSGFRSIGSQIDHGDAKTIAAGQFRFLGEHRHLGDPPDWRQTDAPLLWRFHMHYFEWIWALDAAEDGEWARQVFQELWSSWSDCVPTGDRVAWAPYVASLRAWVLCDVFERLVEGSPIHDEVLDSLWLHARFLRSHLELDVGGNHLIKNLKALVALGVFFDMEPMTTTALERLQRQTAVQVLADGGHFERSPSYHCQVLGDLIDVQRLLLPASHTWLEDAIERMRRWLGAMLGPDGQLPLFNDAVTVGPGELHLLGPIRSEDRLVVLRDTGYVIARPDPDTQLVADVGDPCPNELPAHAHADCLSFELWIGRRRGVVDTGTSTYEPGPRRRYERSTAAHNTVTVDGADQSEVWGVFRVGRRARGLLESARDLDGTITVIGPHDGYTRLPGHPVHRRRWTLRPGLLVVADELSGRGVHDVQSRLRLTTSANVSHYVKVDGGSDSYLVRRSEVALSFGLNAGVTEYQVRRSATQLPVQMTWTLQWGGRSLSGSGPSHEETAV